MGKTVIEDEIKERVEYFEDWMKRLSTKEERNMVVNDKTAIEFIKASLSSDSSLAVLVDEMEKHPASFNQFTNGEYIMSLIEANRTGAKLDVAVGRLRERRIALEKSLPTRTVKDKALRRAVVHKYMTPTMSKQYNFHRLVNKRGVIQYHDNKGRFVSQDSLLKVTGKVLLTSAKKRSEYDKFLVDWKKRNKVKNGS